LKHLIIPDTQVKPDVDLSYLEWIGQYIVEKKPDVLIQIGDFADMPSLSSYDVGKKSFEGRRYKDDIKAAVEGMDILLSPLRDYNEKCRKDKKKQYRPRMVLTLGNHENRIDRATEGDPKLYGTIGIDDLRYAEAGWEVFDFLDPVIIDGVVYSHYLVSGVMGRPIGSASAMISKTHQSCVVGHQQGRQVAYGRRADGSAITCIIAGSCYLHNEEYMGNQGNNHWRGLVVLHEVKDGQFDEMFVSLDYLRKKYAYKR
tara:strand:+ start:664 stop:1434 length:771 start_codon:yes stop_codon:yes gene_type:complete